MKGMKKICILFCVFFLNACSRYDSSVELERAKVLLTTAKQDGLNILFMGVSILIILIAIASVCIVLMVFVAWLQNQKAYQHRQMAILQAQLANQGLMPESKLSAPYEANHAGNRYVFTLERR